MNALLCPLFFCVLLFGCGTNSHKASPIHDAAHTARPPYVDIAVNLGLKYEGDLLRLYDSLASMDVRCGLRAMSLGAEQIVVERKDFDRAKIIATDIIVRDKLTYEFTSRLILRKRRLLR